VRVSGTRRRGRPTLRPVVYARQSSGLSYSSAGAAMPVGKTLPQTVWEAVEEHRSTSPKDLLKQA